MSERNIGAGFLGREQMSNVLYLQGCMYCQALLGLARVTVMQAPENGVMFDGWCEGCTQGLYEEQEFSAGD